MHCFILPIISPNHGCMSEYLTKNLLHTAFLYITYFELKPIFFCRANSSLWCMPQIMKLGRVLLSNRSLKKHQNLNTNSGFIETMRFGVKLHDICFVVFHYLLLKNCGALVVTILFILQSNEEKKIIACDMAAG